MCTYQCNYILSIKLIENMTDDERVKYISDLKSYIAQEIKKGTKYLEIDPDFIDLN